MPFDGVNYTSRLIAGPGERLIELTKGYQALIDEVDWPLVSKFTWRASQSMTNIYARSQYPKDADGKFRPVYLHRLIANPPPHMVVDHKNRHSLDCRRENLRIAYGDQVQNAEYEPGPSGYRGVGLMPSGRYRARLFVYDSDQGRTVARHLGTYDTALEAAQAYDNAALEQWGPFAWTNLPRPILEKPLFHIDAEIPF